ncbi:MAG: aspartate carbamoyltransferase [Thermoplasmata archaeon]|nr:MAG: aspartate carbamoyltransferase [Thermoplasmata archaeon]
MNFKSRNIVSIWDFTKDEVEFILDSAEEMVPIARGEETNTALSGKILATLFYEPSTRTRFSFESAMKRLGGSTVGFADPSGTSFKKGETLADTIKMVDAYSDVIVLRHPQEGSARLAAEFSSKPVINAGDGAGQHPTQTLLDLFTIRQAKGKIEGNKIVFVGDLKYGRTVHSLAYALSMFGPELNFVAPETLQMPKEVVEHVTACDTKVCSGNKLEDFINDADVVYVTRIQKERFPDEAEYQKVAHIYQIKNTLLQNVKDDLIIMHPLPRVDEIAPEVDKTPHARYFEQAFNGIPVRMALLKLVLGVS